MRDSKLICFHCMGKLEQPGQLCPHCGWDNRNRSNGAGYLEDVTLKDLYYVGRALGRGGFGVTYLGYDLNLERVVAIKEYFPGALAARESATASLRPYTGYESAFAHGRQRALDEGRIIANMGHVPNVVQVYHALEANGTVYIVMEYIKGATLSQLVKRSGPLKWEYAYSLLRPIMRALTQVHAKNIIHRDISPDNIILSQETGETVLLDFGAAHPYIEGQGGHTQSLRPGFAPVEQYSSKGVQDGRTDEYALCATFYFLITGETPTDSDQLLLDDKELKPPRELGVDISEAVEKVLLKGMSLHRESRYESISQLMRAFDAAMAAEDTGEQTVKTEYWPPEQENRTIKTGKRAKKKKGKGPLIGIIAGLLTIAVAFGGGILLGNRGGNAPAIVDPTESVTEVPTEEATEAPAVESTVTSTPTATFTATPTAMPTASPTPTAIPVSSWPVLRGDLLEGNYYDEELSDYHAPKVLGSEYLRSEIASITFLDSLADAPSNAWDVSEAGNGSVLAWVKSNGDFYDLYIAGNGGVAAPEDCNSLLADYNNAISMQLDCLDTSKVKNMWRMFQDCTSLTKLDLSRFDTSNVVDMGLMFWNCSSLTMLDLSGFDTSSVMNMSLMFLNCAKLTALDLSGFNTSNVREMEYMFSDCANLQRLDLSDFNTSSVTDMSWMFEGCTSLTMLDLRGFNTSKVTDMSHMFSGCASLARLDLEGFDTSSVTRMELMFDGCSSLPKLDLSGFDTSNVEDMECMFYGCASLTKLDLSRFDTSNVENMELMFHSCTSLTMLDLSGFDTASVTSMKYMFMYCEQLTTIIVSDRFVIDDGMETYGMLSGCAADQLTVINRNL